jgi:hypothetical protein
VTRNDVRRAAQIGVGGEAMARWWSCGFAGQRLARLAACRGSSFRPGYLKLKRAKSQIKF